MQKILASLKDQFLNNDDWEYALNLLLKRPVSTLGFFDPHGPLLSDDESDFVPQASSEEEEYEPREINGIELETNVRCHKKRNICRMAVYLGKF